MALLSDAVALEALRLAQRAHRRPALAPLLEGKRLGPYRGYGELLDEIEILVERGARLSLLGRSVRGEPIFAVQLGVSRPNARTSVTLSAVHPIEWIGVEVHLGLLSRLAGADLDGRSIVSVPIVNPDGLIRVEGDLRAGKRRFVRHNAHGVDLNRNFDARWYDRSIAQRLLPFLFASGSRPASEPEVAALAHHLSSRRIDRALSLHSFGGAVLYPSAATLWPIWDAAEHRAWAKRIAAAADERPYRAMSCAVWSLGLAGGGLELDWLHDRHGAVSLLIECSRRNVGLHPARLLQPFAWFNPRRPAPVVHALVDAILPYVRGDGL
ncbi:Carboxypeptidase T [Minicystis rosea]|nr:Carboxypeptidase T [Minicystis rosea]